MSAMTDVDTQLPEVVESQGEFAGWHLFPAEKFNRHVGPFYHRVADNGSICAFRPSEKNTNGTGMVHGGSLLTFADFSMYVLAQSYYSKGAIVTVSMASQFLGAARPDELIESRTEIVSAGKSLIVLRGIMTAAQKPVLSYSGTFKRLSGAPG